MHSGQKTDGFLDFGWFLTNIAPLFLCQKNLLEFTPPKLAEARLSMLTSHDDSFLLCQLKRTLIFAVF